MIASAHHQQQPHVDGRIGGGDFKGRGIEEGIITHTPFPSVRYVFCQRNASQLLPASMQSSNPTAAAQMACMTGATQALASTTRTSVMNAADGAVKQISSQPSRRFYSYSEDSSCGGSRSLAQRAFGQRQPSKLCRGLTTSFECHSDNGPPRRHFKARRVTDRPSRYEPILAIPQCQRVGFC